MIAVEQELFNKIALGNEQAVHEYKDKPELTGSTFSFFEKTLSCITAVHNFGDKKYSPYSWQNDPVNSNATMEYSLNALFRHYTLLKSGQTIDDSGFHHLSNLACRSNMLLTRYYRIYFKTESQIKVNDIELLSKKNKDKQKLYKEVNRWQITPRQISPELAISMLKFTNNLVPDTYELCESLFWSSLWECIYLESITTQNLCKVISLPDTIFYCVAQMINLSDHANISLSTTENSNATD